MATPSLIQQSLQGKKLITGLVGGALALAIVVVAVAYLRSPERRSSTVRPPQPVPRNVNRQLSGYTYTRSEQGRRVFSIHAARTVAFNQSDSTVLEGVYVEVFGPAGNRHDLLRTERCDYHQDSQEFFASGKVSIELNAFGSDASSVSQASLKAGESPPIYVETSGVSFKQEGSVVDTTEPVTFSTRNASGTARGLSYQTQTGSLELKKEVVLHLTPQGGPAPPVPVTLTATRLRFEKEKNEVTLSGPIEVTQAGRQVSAGAGEILLLEGRRVSLARLEDGVRASQHSEAGTASISALRFLSEFDPASGYLKRIHGEGHVGSESASSDGKVSHLSADSIELAFSGKHPQPVAGTVSGNADLQIERPMEASSAPSSPAKTNLPASGREELAASEIQFVFRRGQQILEHAQTVGAGHLTIFPSSGQAGEREAFAEPLVMDFDAKGRLEELHGLSHAKVIAHPPKLAKPGMPDDVSTSNRLDARFDPTTGAMMSMEQAGDFHLTEGDRKAMADRAVFEAHDQTVTLTGHPSAADPEAMVRADRIVINLQRNTVAGAGEVQSTQLEAARAPTGRRQTPVIPTNIVADRVVAHRDTGIAHYEGHVRAWHGRDVMEAPSLEVYNAQRRITASSGVVTSFIQPASSAEPKGAALSHSTQGPSPVTIRAEHLDYAESDQKGTYRGHVELRTEDSILRADRLDVYLSPGATDEASQVDRAVADGHVTVFERARRATGNHAEYMASAGKIVVTGGPPSVYDPDNGFTSGHSLTLFLHDDTILVDGGDQSPTISKRRISP